MREPCARDEEVTELLLKFNDQDLKEARCLHESLREGAKRHSAMRAFEEENHKKKTQKGGSSANNTTDADQMLR